MYFESDLVKETKQYVKDIFYNEISDDFYLHNFAHTEQIVDASVEIAKATELNEEDTELVLVAAWIQDIGYYKSYNDHETHSKEMARQFLEGKLPEPKIGIILNAIEATRIPQKPKDTVGQILCDADLYYLATDQFMAKCMLLKKEQEAHGRDILSEKQWNAETLRFVHTHSYFTNYGKYVLTKKKEKSIGKLRKEKVEEISQKYVDQLQTQLVKLKNKLDKEQDLKPTRGIETMFRITSMNHLTLSGMADNKANIMISVNSIILSIILTVLFRKFDDTPQLLIPAFALTTSSMITIIFAILATRPSISKGKFTEAEIKNRKTNLLFFGNFHGMGLDNYLWGMNEMMKDGKYLYNSLIKDIYFLGVVLGKKYKFLRISYTVFMYGLVISILLFSLALIYPSLFVMG